MLRSQLRSARLWGTTHRDQLFIGIASAVIGTVVGAIIGGLVVAAITGQLGGNDEDKREGTPPANNPSAPADDSDPPVPTGTLSQTTTVPLTVSNGEQIFRPETGEVYVVKIANDERYKRHFLSAKIRDTYPRFFGVEPTDISQEEFDSFIISCLVKFGSDYYFLDVSEGEDEAMKHLIADGQQGLGAAGVSEAAIFEVHALEINDPAFTRDDAISASEATQKTCGGS